jgi:hypothetical protein
MIDFFTELGFSKQDMLLLIITPIFSALGSLVNILSLDLDLKTPVETQGNIKFIKGVGNNITYIEWAIRRIIIGAVAGLILALYFVGALTEKPTTIARILAFSILLGYAAPNFWSTQEKIMIAAMESKLKQIIKEQKLEDKANEDKGDNVAKSPNSGTDS